MNSSISADARASSCLKTADIPLSIISAARRSLAHPMAPRSPAAMVVATTMETALNFDNQTNSVVPLPVFRYSDNTGVESRLHKCWRYNSGNLKID